MTGHLYKYVLIGCLSCSLLMYEVLLIRICSLRLAFHFGFLVISNCLLAFGASGTLITLKQARFRADARLWLGRFSFAYLISLAGTYLFLCTYPVAASVLGLLTLSDPRQLLHFTFFNLVASVPFFLGGTVVGMLLTFSGEQVNRLYFVDLVGAALGCLLAPAALAAFGAGGSLVALFLLALAGSLGAMQPPRRKPVLVAAALLALSGLWLMPRLDRLLPVRGRLVIELTSMLSIDQSAGGAHTKWTATSRIDLLPVTAPGEIFGRGANREGLPPVPEMRPIVQDANAGTVMVNFSDHPEALEVVRNSLYSAAVRLKERPRVFIIGVGGGNDVWAAYAAGASRVKAVELNEPILDIHRRIYPHFSRALTRDPRIELVADEGRSALMHDTGTYDVIQLTGVDTWTGLKSGAYVLAENYLYTREALGSMFDRLAEDGIVQITRMSKEMEALRMVSNFWAAFPRPALDRFPQSVMAIRTGDDITAFLAKPAGFTQEEIASMLAFVGRNAITPVYIPGQRYRNEVAEYIRTPYKNAYALRYPRNITATTDDRPYFFNFTRWSQPWASRKLVGEPSSVSQGNPFFLLVQLGLSLALSLLLIVLPLVGRTGLERRGALRLFAYFAGVGLGFIMIEVGMIQKLTVFLGHPLYSITVTLAGLLFFAGLGSLLSTGWRRKVWLVPLALTVFMVLFYLSWPLAFESLITLSLPVRIAAALAVLAPAGLILGVPFAYGLRLAGHHNPSLVPWAWAINGCFSVLGSIATVIVSMTLGFYLTLALAVAVYLICFSAVLPLMRDYAGS